MKKKPKKITIVGAGLVGSLLSIYLAKRGYDVSVFESRYDMRTHMFGGGRSINLALSTRGIRSLEEVGLAMHMKEHAMPMNGRMMHNIRGHLTFQPYGEQGQYINSISRTGLNIALIDEAEKQGVEFQFEHRCLNADLAKTELTFQFFGSTMRHQSDAIIGADGMFSAVRNAFKLVEPFDYSENYVEHGYKELRIPPVAGGGFPMEKNALHIWPRESFMLIALPNPDTTFTCTLFLPFKGDPSFAQLQTPEQIQAFFEKLFPDAASLMPTLIEDFRDNPTSSLVTIRCYPWVKKNVLLMGDAAHGIVPFYGQGMNAGFEDCRIFNRLLDQFDDDWELACTEFQRLRKPDADAIAQLALDNFVEMRDLVGTADFLLRKQIEARLHELYPNRWIPLYSMVTFHEQVRYSEAYETGQKQKKIMDQVMTMPEIATKWTSLNFEEIVNQL
ncbi:MAG TPA: NAD(P)/FAD-dependent oxidoreductase [Cyclobacteriaceae bacterium]|nr:NAD(P)/FAD-dependent oxidoreductase [Cyclobacteriaceae bacterium]